MGGGEEGVDKKTDAKCVAGLTARIVKTIGKNVRVKTNDTLKDSELICC